MRKVSLGLGLGLLLLNFYGVVFSSLQGPQARQIISYGLSLPEDTRVEVTAHRIAQFMTHRESTPVPWSENFILRALSYTHPLFYAYEFTDYQRGLRRGYGVCSQAAIVTAGIFAAMGYQTRLLGLNGHVVAAVDDIIVDADLGVILPFDIDAAQKNPGSVAAFYEAAGHSADSAHGIAEIFGVAGNRIFETAFAYRPKMYVIEVVAYVMKWLLPIMLMVVGVWPMPVEQLRRLLRRD